MVSLGHFRWFPRISSPFEAFLVISPWNLPIDSGDMWLSGSNLKGIRWSFSIISGHFRLFPVVFSPFLETPMENGLGLPIDSGDLGTDSHQICSTKLKHFEAFSRKKILFRRF